MSLQKLVVITSALALPLHSAYAESGSAPSPCPTSHVQSPAFIPNSAVLLAGSSINELQLRMLLRDLEARNKCVSINQAVSDLLGLTKNGSRLVLQYRAILEDDGITHGFYRLGGNAGYLILKRTATELTVSEIDPTLKHISTVVNRADQPTSVYVVPLSSIANALLEELKYWARIADDLSIAKQ